MAVHGEVNVRADRLAHGRHHLRHLPEIGRREGAVEAPRRRNRLVHVHLERPEALRDGRTRHRGVLLLDVPRPTEEAVHVDRDVSATPATEQVVDRLAGGLTDNVPERRLDPAQGRRVQPAAVQRLPVQLDPEGVLPHKVLAGLLDAGQHPRRLIAERLTEAHDPGIRVDLDKQHRKPRPMPPLDRPHPHFRYPHRTPSSPPRCHPPALCQPQPPRPLSFPHPGPICTL